MTHTIFLRKLHADVQLFRICDPYAEGDTERSLNRCAVRLVSGFLPLAKHAGLFGRWAVSLIGGFKTGTVKNALGILTII
jgi:hypothetical protein